MSFTLGKQKYSHDDEKKISNSIFFVVLNINEKNNRVKQKPPAEVNRIEYRQEKKPH